MANVKLSQEKAYRIILKGYPDVLDIKQCLKSLASALRQATVSSRKKKLESNIPLT
ncbi:hypothetical protein [Dehalobacter sp. TBBPA1]|uniref:hypothetical protein n=1 Tax=Dehalobacter sp. TBBPA1 TaxID=3235037 RepID=UPI0034A2FC77